MKLMNLGKNVKLTVKDGKLPMEQIMDKVRALSKEIPIKMPFAADGFKSSKQPNVPNPIIIEPAFGKQGIEIVKEVPKEIEIPKKIKEVPKEVKIPKEEPKKSILDKIKSLGKKKVK